MYVRVFIHRFLFCKIAIIQFFLAVLKQRSRNKFSMLYMFIIEIKLIFYMIYS